jgi:deferrochelatase/peroxidase EfeB
VSHVQVSGATVRFSFFEFGRRLRRLRQARRHLDEGQERRHHGRTGGDVLISIAAGHQDTVAHAVRELVEEVRGALAPRWTVAGFQGAQRGPSPPSTRPNHFGFHDGTSNPFDADGQLNVGLLFVAFNQDIGRQFAAIQERLNDEPMVDYITPEGGGHFFAPAASRDPPDWVGSGLFA